MRKTFLLITLVLFLCLIGTARSQTPVRDVNVVNHSFELDDDGNQVCGHTVETLGIGWTLKNNWIGQDVPCWTPYFCMDCDPNDPEQEGGACNCKTWPASDGYVMAYMQTRDTSFEQILDETINARTMYTLKMDAMTWDPDVWYTASVTYLPPGETTTTEVVSKDIWLEESESVETAEWKEYSVVLVVPDGHPAIGSELGIKFFSHIGEDDWRWPFLDNIRVQAQLATDAYFPTPEDKAINVRLDATHLKWYPGLWTPSGHHDVYFGTSFEEVDEATIDDTTGVYKGRQDVNSWPIDTELQIGAEYFWRVDEYNESFVPNPLDPNSPPASPWRSHVWSFRMNDGKAFDFNPEDEGEMVAVDVDLQWKAGIAAEWHDVYFSSNFDDVNNRVEDCLMSATQPLADTTYSPYANDGIELVLGKTYYWAVDEFNSTTTGSPWRSNVLSFRAADYHVVDNFNSYADISELWEVWKDVYYNETGSGVNVYVTEVRDGNSLSFEYQNTFWPYYSEIEADIADLFGPDWTANSAEALVLWFCGDVGNRVSSNDRMYVGLEGSSGASSYAEVRYPGDMNNILLATWQEWNIDLDDFAGIDLTNVSKMYLGFGDRENPAVGEYGYVYFEDFRLYPTRCAPVMAWGMGSLDDDCVVEYDDLGIMGDQWLLEAKGVVTPAVVSTPPVIWYKLDDLSGSTKPTTTLNSGSFGTNWNGTFGPLPNDPSWVQTGQFEDALLFDNDSGGAEGDYVSFPALNLNSNTVSITAWMRRLPNQAIYAPVVFTRGRDDLGTTTTVGLGLGSTGDDGDPSWAVNNELCYHWADAENSWSWHNGLIVPEQAWTFIALTVAPDEAMLYMSDGTSIRAASNYAPHAPEAFDETMYLSWDTIDINFLDPDSFNDRHLNGYIDEVRIYNYTLSPGQILTVAGLSGSHYIPFESWRPDLVSDDVINFKDYDILADNWLQEVLWP